jgi:hypothetical protein
VALPLVLLTGLFDGPAFVALISIRQRVAPARLRGQIFTTASSVHTAAFAAGQVGAAVVYQAFGTTATLLTLAVLFALAGAVTLLAQSDLAGAPAATAQPSPLGVNTDTQLVRRAS